MLFAGSTQNRGSAAHYRSQSKDKEDPGNLYQQRPEKQPTPPVAEAMAARVFPREIAVLPIRLCLLEIRLLIPNIWVSVPTPLKSANLISLIKH